MTTLTVAHFPGDHPAVLPYHITPEGDALYRCPCGREWLCRRDEAGWPVERVEAA